MIKREIANILKKYNYTNVNIIEKFIICNNPLGESRIFAIRNISNNNVILAERGIVIYSATPTGLESVDFENVTDIKAVSKDITIEKDGQYIIIKFTDFFLKPTEEEIRIINEAYSE